MTLDLLGLACILFALGALLIVVWFLVTRPPLLRATRLALLVGIGIFPIGAAMTGNVRGYLVSQQRPFCSSCHVMTPYTDDSDDPTSPTLASAHARNEAFGKTNCYGCHSDYELFGTITTKISGLGHLYMYYSEYRDATPQEAIDRIRLYKPYRNSTCMHCHSTQIPGWIENQDHRGALQEIRSGAMGCASAGCHGPSHPFSKSSTVSGAKS